MKVVVAVLTYRREEELHGCLLAIQSAAGHISGSVDVVIGDNDPDSHHTEAYIPGAVRVHVGLKSVSAGRQFLLAAARRDGYEYLAFIDDDELVSPTWLKVMLETAENNDCSAVAGPVSPLNLKPSDLPLHVRTRHATGTVVQSAGAGNLLLNLRRVRLTDFDTEWKLSGGEDTDFTLRMSRDEGPIIWCDEGEVFEPVIASRLSRAWLVKRYFSNGRILCHAQRSIQPRAVLSRLPIRIIVLAVSVIRLILLPLSSRTFRYFLDNGVRNAGFIYEAASRK